MEQYCSKLTGIANEKNQCCLELHVSDRHLCHLKNLSLTSDIIRDYNNSYMVLWDRKSSSSCLSADTLSMNCFLSFWEHMPAIGVICKRIVCQSFVLCLANSDSFYESSV